MKTFWKECRNQSLTKRNAGGKKLPVFDGSLKFEEENKQRTVLNSRFTFYTALPKQEEEKALR